MARYNYIFSHDRPQRGGQYRGMIYVPETGETYRNISEASKALGVDASNISKVIKGSRRTAGGYHFEKTTEEEDKRRKILKQVREEIRRANDVIKEAREAQRENFVQEVAELDDFGTDTIGSTQDNLIDDAAETLDNMDIEDLEQLRDKLKEKIEKAIEGLKKADERLQEYADVFGVTPDQMAKYEPMIPEINNTIDRAHDNGCGSDVFFFIRDQIQNDVDPDALRELLDKINGFFDNPRSGEDIWTILNAWEFRKYNGKSWEDTKNQHIW